jgi:hypothetical protein
VSGTTWVELVFMMVILKLPIVYVCLVVWWAIRAPEEQPLEGAPLPVVPTSDPRGSGRRPGLRLAPRGPRPHGRPVRSYPRMAAARARVER